jgi:hypothetical protein
MNTDKIGYQLKSHDIALARQTQFVSQLDKLRLSLHCRGLHG